MQYMAFLLQITFPPTRIRFICIPPIPLFDQYHVSASVVLLRSTSGPFPLDSTYFPYADPYDFSQSCSVEPRVEALPFSDLCRIECLRPCMQPRSTQR